MQIKLTSGVSAAIVSTTKTVEIFFQKSVTIIQFNKEVMPFTDDLVKLQTLLKSKMEVKQRKTSSNIHVGTTFICQLQWLWKGELGKNQLKHSIRINCRASLVAQWLRILLPMQGTRVQALLREDPTCRRATKPVRHNY